MPGQGFGLGPSEREIKEHDAQIDQELEKALVKAFSDALQTAGVDTETLDDDALKAGAELFRDRIFDEVMPIGLRRKNLPIMTIGGNI